MDVKKSNLNPLIHYKLYGIDEGRKVSVDIYQNKKELLYLETLKKNINNEITIKIFVHYVNHIFLLFYLVA